MGSDHKRIPSRTRIPTHAQPAGCACSKRRKPNDGLVVVKTEK
jgi:hypothetical protein